MALILRIVLLAFALYLMLFSFGVAQRIDQESVKLLDFLPQLFGPIVGLMWISLFTFEISTAPSGTRYGAFFILGYLVIAYVILAVTFSAGYLAMSNSGVGQVLVAENKYEPIKDDGHNMVYYSFVTASTLGYGDFVPAGRCRTLACVRVVFFLMFIGVGLLYVQWGSRTTIPTEQLLEALGF